MYRKTIVYRLLFALLAFALALILPLSLIIRQNSTRMLEEIEAELPLTAEQKAVFTKFSGRVGENLISMTFYVFILAFIISLFYSRNILAPIKELYRGAQDLKEGKLDIKLDYNAEDELGEVVRAFNDMAVTLMEKNRELMRKDLYIGTMLDPLWVVDEDDVIVDINPAFTKLFGYEMDEAVGTSLFDFLDAENENIMRRQLYARQEGIGSTYALSIISKQGELIPVLISGSPIKNEDGEVIGKIGIMKDFRDEMKLREALTKARDYREAIMDSMVDPLIVLDKNFNIIMANKAAVNEAGRNVIGENCHSLFHNSPSRCKFDDADCPVKTVFATGRNYKTTHTHLTAKGENVSHEIICYPIKDSGGNITHAVEIMRDVTDKARYEKEIALKNRELTTLNSISMLLNKSLRAEDIFNSVLDAIIELTDMDGGGIYFMDEKGRELTCKYHRGLSEEFLSKIRWTRTGQDVTGRTAATGQIFTATDISRDPVIEKSILQHTGIKGYSCFPIRGKERTLGVFYIFSFSPHAFSEEEERIFKSIGEMTGIAFENIRLYERMRDLYDRQMRRRSEEQKNLLGLTSLLATKLDLKDVLDSTLTLIKHSFKADFMWLLEQDDRGDLVLRSAPEAGLKEGSVLYEKKDPSIESFAIKSKKPLIVSDLSAETKYLVSEHVRHGSFRTACSVPVFAGTRSLGAFTLYYGSFKEPSEEDIYFLQTIASMLYVAMERSRLYEKAAVSKGMSDTVLDSIADGIITVNTDGRIISINRAAERITGIPAGTLLGNASDEAFGPDENNAGFQKSFNEGLRLSLGGETTSYASELFTPDKRSVPLIMNSAPILDAKGRVSGAVNILRDISREKEIDRMKTDFVNAVSHEFRTPLSAIVGMTEMVLEEDVAGERKKAYLETILSESIRLSEMVSDLLDVAAIESGKEVFREDEISFAYIIAELEEEFKPAMHKKEATLSCDLNGDVEGFRGDSDKIKQLFRNLIENSLTYSDNGVSINLLVKKTRGHIKLSVKDDGWGIPEADLSHSGEKFFRGAHGTTTKGTGLGLSLTSNIASMHGGKMDIKSKAGKGTTVTITLPLRRDS